MTKSVNMTQEDVKWETDDDITLGIAEDTHTIDDDIRRVAYELTL